MRRRTGVIFAVIVVLAFAGVVAFRVIEKDRGGDYAGVGAGQPRAPDAAPDRGARRDRGGDRAGVEGGEARTPDTAPDREAGTTEAREGMRQRLMAGGATEADVEAIEAYRTRQRELMEALRGAMQSLREAGGEDATGAQAEQAIRDHEAAMRTALSELAKAEEALRARLSLSTKPKLHAMLLSMGVLDNGMRGSRAGGEGGRGARRGGGAPADERGGPRGGGAARGGRGGGAAPGA